MSFFRDGERAVPGPQRLARDQWHREVRQAVDFPVVSSGMMWGWVQRVHSAISRSNRVVLVPTAISCRRTLTTTRRWSRVSVATNT
ncbi:MAG TPA: hypothetical protein VFU23_17000 [Gemmatimonadales bacterium]|nr:hypothetical protein [Gemmatimonadales bacterium]